ncbi:MAG: MerR family transcriptional regulator [Sphingobium sp.]
MNKQQGAFLTIGELASDLGVPQHILRYWETRFPMLRPLQRAGNRRYYRAEDVDLARRIHHLLTVEGYTVRGAQQALSGRTVPPPSGRTEEAEQLTEQPMEAEAPAVASGLPDRAAIVGRLKEIRSLLETAL